MRSGTRTLPCAVRAPLREASQPPADTATVSPRFIRSIVELNLTAPMIFAQKAYQGVLARISLSKGLTNLTTISIGTNVGDYAYYIGRTKATNDFHGLGSFLIMNEQLRTTPGTGGP